MTRLKKAFAVGTTAVLALAGTLVMASPAAAATHNASTEAELIVAISAANATLGPDTIELTGPGFTLSADLPHITDDLTIVGPGSGSLAIDAANHSGFYADAAGTVSISGLTLADDRSTSPYSGILSTDTNLVLDDVTATGLLHGVQASGAGSVAVTDSTFSNNRSRGMNLTLQDGSVSTLDGVTTSDNGGPGVDAELNGNARLTVSDSTSTTNFSGYKVAGFNTSAVSFANVTVDQSRDHGFSLDVTGTATASFTNVSASNSFFDGISVKASANSEVTLSGVVATNNNRAGVFLSLRNNSVSTVDRVDTSGNADYGLYAALTLNAGLTVSDSTSTTDKYGYFVIGQDTSTVSFSSLTADQSQNDGFYLDFDGAATASYTNVSASNSGGAGISVQSSSDNAVTFSGAQAINNTKTGVTISSGGADASASTVTITDSTISGNGDPGSQTGGVSVDDPRGLTILISNTTVSGNSSISGGGIYAEFGLTSGLDLTVVNSTISGNTGVYGGAVFVQGSDNPASSLAILNSTLTDNSTQAGSDAGVVILGDFPIQVRNSILAGNLSGGVALADLDIQDSTTAAINYSLIRVPSTLASPLVVAGTGNLTGVDPKLGPLTDNGGPTLTHLLLEDSPAIDAGDPTFSGLTTDQRHLQRVVMRLDMGAVESATYNVSTQGDLAKAINDANAAPGPDTIVLTGPGFTLTADLPIITDDLTIVGPGSGSLVIAAANYSVFSASAAGTVSISGLTLADDRVTSPYSGILSADTNLVLDDVTVDGFLSGVDTSGGSVAFTDSTFSDNFNTGLNLALSDQSVSTLDGITTSGNGAPGLFTILSVNAQLTVSDSTSTSDAVGFYVVGHDTSSVSFSNVTVDQSQHEGFFVEANDAATATYTNVSTSNGDEEGILVETYSDSSVIFSGAVATNNDGDGINLFAHDGSTISFTSTTVTGNESDGVEANATDSATITLTSVTATDNGADGADLDAGHGATIILNGATISDSLDNGLELDAFGAGSTVNVTGAIVTGSMGGDGAVVNAGDSGSITLSSSVIANNTDSGVTISSGGADASASTVTITDSTISANGSPGVVSSGVSIKDPGGMAVLISNTTVSGNSSVFGGGIYAEFDPISGLDLTVVNSTISGNTGVYGGAVFVQGMDTPDSSLAILNSTVTDNSTETDGDAGFVILGDFPIQLRNSIIAGNISGAAALTDLDIPDSTIAVIAYSLIGVPSTLAAPNVAAGTGNLTGVDPKLGPLADNGGPTLTHLLLEGSPAIDAGDPTFSGLTTDQRHVQRVVISLDLGALEIQPAVLAVTGTEFAPRLIAGGIMLLGLGVLTLVFVRRRRAAH